MHDNEEWTVWNPTNMESTRAFSVEIVKEDEATRFTVECASRMIDVLFYGFVPIYVYSYEGIRIATYAPVQEKKQDKYYFQSWFLYRVDNSDFMDWAVKEGCGFYEKDRLQHYCIVTEDDVVDILSFVEPSVVVRDK